MPDHVLAPLRPAKPQDLEAVLQLLRDHKLPTAGVAEHFEHFVLQHDAHNCPIACVGLELYGDAALLRSVVVQQSQRGQRLGQALVQHVLQTAKTKGVTSVALLTESAQDYFVRFGFQTCQRHELPKALQASQEFQGACPDSATAMRLGLGVN